MNSILICITDDTKRHLYVNGCHIYDGEKFVGDISKIANNDFTLQSAIDTLRHMASTVLLAEHDRKEMIKKQLTVDSNRI